MSCPPPPVITLAGSRLPLENSVQKQGDTPSFAIKFRGTGLTGASLRFTAKTCVDDPDSVAEIKKTSASSGGIVIDTTNSTDGLLLATMSWLSTDTSTIDIPPDTQGRPGKIRLSYDLQLVVGSKVETIEGSSEFWVQGEVTKTNS